MENGIDPERELDRRDKDWRLVREEREGGIWPEKEFSEMSKVVRCVRRETRGVSEPV